MKLVTCAMTALMCNFTHAAIEPHIQNYLNHAEQQQLDQQVTWQRLMYADQAKKSEVVYKGYFYAEDGQTNLKHELQADIQALFISAPDNQSIRCKFPARSRWLIQQLRIDPQ